MEFPPGLSIEYFHQNGRALRKYQVNTWKLKVFAGFTTMYTITKLSLFARILLSFGGTMWFTTVFVSSSRLLFYYYKRNPLISAIGPFTQPQNCKLVAGKHIKLTEIQLLFQLAVPPLLLLQE